MTASPLPDDGTCIWFNRETLPETFGLDAAVVMAGLRKVCDAAAVVEIRVNADGAVHSLRLRGSEPALTAVALDLREKAARHKVTVMSRPWPEWADAWVNSAPT